MKYYSHHLLTFQIVNNRLKENTILVTRSENLTTWSSCRHFVLSTFILSFPTSLLLFLSTEFQWVSFHQQNIFNSNLCHFFSSRVMRFCIRNSLNRICASAPIFLVVTLYFYLYGERNIKPFQAVHVPLRTIFVISTCEGGTLFKT